MKDNRSHCTCPVHFIICNMWDKLWTRYVSKKIPGLYYTKETDDLTENIKQALRVRNLA